MSPPEQGFPTRLLKQHLIFSLSALALGLHALALALAHERILRDFLFLSPATTTVHKLVCVH